MTTPAAPVAGYVTTIAGVASPFSIAIDVTGNIYAATASNHVIQRLTPTATSPHSQAPEPQEPEETDQQPVAHSIFHAESPLARQLAPVLDRPTPSASPVRTPAGPELRLAPRPSTDKQSRTATEATTITVYGKRELASDYANAEGPTGSIARLYMATFARDPEVKALHSGSASSIAA